MTRFYIPNVESDDLAAEVYRGIVLFASESTGWGILSDRIEELEYFHNGHILRAKVGEREPNTGEQVLAILRSNAYLVCTPNRGVLRGLPILVGTTEVSHRTLFDDQ